MVYYLLELFPRSEEPAELDVLLLRLLLPEEEFEEEELRLGLLETELDRELLPRLVDVFLPLSVVFVRPLVEEPEEEFLPELLPVELLRRLEEDPLLELLLPDVLSCLVDEEAPGREVEVLGREVEVLGRDVLGRVGVSVLVELPGRADVLGRVVVPGRVLLPGRVEVPGLVTLPGLVFVFGRIVTEPKSERRLER